MRNIVASAFVTARAEYRAAKPVEIILDGGVTAEINYVPDEIPGLRAVTIENGLSPNHSENRPMERSRFQSSRPMRPTSMIIRLWARGLN